MPDGREMKPCPQEAPRLPCVRGAAQNFSPPSRIPMVQEGMTMSRNEYRRAFIMLRAVQPGYGGHVRLERRTLTGSMYFTITAPPGR